MDELRDLAWDYAAARAFSEDLPMAAARAPADGADSPSLRELAGLGRRSDPEAIRSLFELALAELDIALPSHEQAGRRDLHRLARELVNGQKSARETARICYFADYWMNEVEHDFVGQCCYFDDLVDILSAEHVRIAERHLRKQRAQCSNQRQKSATRPTADDTGRQQTTSAAQQTRQTLLGGSSRQRSTTLSRQ